MFSVLCVVCWLLLFSVRCVSQVACCLVNVVCCVSFCCLLFGVRVLRVLRVVRVVCNAVVVRCCFVVMVVLRCCLLICGWCMAFDVGGCWLLLVVVRCLLFVIECGLSLFGVV